jgi:hypothetical protein
MTSKQLGERWTVINGPAVPQQHDVTAEVTQQQSQEGSDFEVAEVVEMVVTVEAETLAFAARRHRRDGREREGCG